MKTGGSFSFRWGNALLDGRGDVSIPGFIMRNYSKIGLKGREFELIAHLASFKYESERGQSRPALMTIANRMGYDTDRQVRRMVSRLRKAGLLLVHFVAGAPSTYDFVNLTNLCLKLDQEQSHVENDTPVENDRGTPVRYDMTPLSDMTPEEKEEEKEKKKKKKDMQTTPRGDDPATEKPEEPCKASALRSEGQENLSEETQREVVAIEDSDEPESPAESVEEEKVLKAKATGSAPSRGDEKTLQRQRLLESVAEHVFGITGAWSKQDGGRIGQHVKWIMQTYPGAQPETISAFRSWYRKQYRDAAMPRSKDKFREHFAAFHSSVRGQSKGKEMLVILPDGTEEMMYVI